MSGHEPGWTADGRCLHGGAVRLAVLMADQPDSRPGAPERNRNAELLSAVIRRHESKLRRQAYRHSELPEDAEDALQSAFLHFVERYNGLGEPLAWLYTTVKREAWALRRRSSRQRECSLTVASSNGTGDIDLTEAVPTDAPGPAERLERDELLTEQLRALSALKSDQRRALGLLALGLSYAEICETTGWTHTKVNRCLSEGRSALRQ
jgi:RNA polymerase sigma factor (sigma-70 family)